MGNGKGCSIPQGSKGRDKVYDIVSKYNGFNFENVIKSASCTDNQIFVLWKKWYYHQQKYFAIPGMAKPANNEQHQQPTPLLLLAGVWHLNLILILALL